MGDVAGPGFGPVDRTYQSGAAAGRSGSSPGAVPNLSLRPRLSTDRSPAEGGVYVGTVRVTGAAGVASSALKAIEAGYAGRSLSQRDMEALLQSVTAAAHARGFLFAHASIPTQDLSTGVLEVRLDMGRIDEIRQTGGKSAAVERVLSVLKGHAPTKGELERQLLLAADTPGVVIGQVSFEREGTDGVLIVPIAMRPVSITAAADNQGLPQIGPLRARIGVQLNGVLRPGDSLIAQAVTTPAAPKELGAVSVRYGGRVTPSGTELAVTASYSQTHPGPSAKEPLPNVQTYGVGVSATQPLIRRREESLWASLQLNVATQVQTYPAVPAPVSRTPTLSASLNGYVDLLGGRLRGEATATHELSGLGATAVPAPQALSPSRGFTILGGSINWAGPLLGPFSARVAVAGQASNASLPGLEQISLGGDAFGRGYDVGARLGDTGILGSAELQATLLDRNQGFLRWAQVYGFADGGRLTNVHDDAYVGEVYSAGFGARTAIDGAVRTGLEIAFPLTRDYLNKTPRVTFNIESTF